MEYLGWILYKIRRKCWTMTDSKKPSLAQDTTNHLTAGREVGAKKKTSALDQSEAKRKSAKRGEQSLPDVTRFGDWEKNGRCIDF